MNTISTRSTKVFGPLIVLGAMVLAGCATTNGTVSSASAARPAAIESPAPGGSTICSGGYASRFPERQAMGRVCRTSLSFSDIY
jgi:hypothetical protein